MSDFDEMVDELLRSRPELTRDELMRRIEEKKDTVGAGYLTDQGALFLVAGELGVALQRKVSNDLVLKDLYIGANDITVVARVLGIGPATTYKKKDGGSGRYRRVTLFDKERTVKLTLWDDGVDEPEKLVIGVGSPVRVVSGYVKQGLDGKPNLNLGSRGRLELVKDDALAAKLASLDEVAEKLTKLTEEKPFHALDCVVASEPRYSEFVRSDGSPGSLFQFEVMGQGGNDRCRVVIWSPSERPELKVGQQVRITSLRVRRSSRGEFELHGDANSAVTKNLKRTTVELRVAAVSSAAGNSTILALDRDKKVRVVEAPVGEELVKGGDVIVAAPDQELNGRMTCRSPGSLSQSKDSSFPDLADLSVKVKNAKDEAAQIMVEVIALSHGTAEDVRMRDGSVVKKGELMVGDDTGEIGVVGWREQSGKVLGIQPGERLRMVGVTAKSTKMGAWTLQLSGLTVIERLKGRN